MDKRYQVFVSSTYDDLQVERQHIIHALLSMDCIPSGMELFPASDDDQWTLIKRVIDDCDYYLLILAGRYGSTGDDGIGYTEKEFDYAIEMGKPVISFLHGNPGSLAFDNSEHDLKPRKKLDAFRDKAKRKMVQFWTSPEELGAKVSTSLAKLIKSHPAEGWVKARYATGSDEVLRLRARVSELEFQFASGSRDATNPVRSLSPEALEILKGAAASHTGRILARDGMDGYRIQAGEFVFQEDGNPRDAARYRAIISSLEEALFIEKVTEGLYKVSHEGFKLVDRLVGTSTTGEELERPVMAFSSEEVEYLKAAANSDGRIYGRQYTDGYQVHAGHEEFSKPKDEGHRGRYEGFIRRLYEAGHLSKIAQDLYELNDSGKALVGQLRVDS